MMPLSERDRELEERKARIRASRKARARAYLANEVDGGRRVRRFITGALFTLCLAIILAGMGTVVYQFAR